MKTRRALVALDIPYLARSSLEDGWWELQVVDEAHYPLRERGMKSDSPYVLLALPQSQTCWNRRGRQPGAGQLPRTALRAHPPA